MICVSTTWLQCARWGINSLLRCVWSVEISNIIRISHTHMTFSLIIHWCLIYFHSCVLMNFVWPVNNFILCILRHHDKPFDVKTCFWCHDELVDVMTKTLTLLEVITNLLSLWRLFDILMNFLTSWRVYDIMTNFD